MLNFIRKSIRRKFIFYLSLLIVFFITLLVILTFIMIEQYSLKNAEEFSKNIIDQTDDKINMFFNEVELLAKSYSTLDFVINKDEELIRELFLQTSKSRSNYIDSIYLGTKDGDMFIMGWGQESYIKDDGYVELPSGYDPRTRPWYKDALQKNGYIITEPYVYVQGGIIGVTCAMPVYNEQNEIIGVVGIDLTLNLLQNIVRDIRVPNNGKVILLDEKEDKDSEEIEIGAIVNQFIEGVQEARIIETMEDLMDSDVELDIVDFGKNNIIITSNESGSFIGDIYDERMFVSFNKIDLIGWKLLIAIPYQELIRDGRRTLNVIIFSSSIMLIIVIIVLVMLIKNLTNPLAKIVSLLKLSGEGDLTKRINIKSVDEIGSLAKAFNMMSTKLQESFTQIAEQNKQIKEYNEHLEEKVEERTAELNKTNLELEKAFEEVTGLKVQQDGDYFLTSLLLKPLFSNSVESENINVDFYYSQKKKFTFKKWNEELGGDICIAHSIMLYEKELTNEIAKEYTVFVNGDAMGKSIQGAGGSLVLGVVFNAFVTRTKFVPGTSSIPPEEWLVKCYRELQDVFVSFDGTMLISVVMGIVDDNSGMMYYFNAEHPWTVLYRSKKAEFIENELLNRKIGTTLNTDRVKIRTFQLYSQDVIIAGSDGRDDLLLDYDEETNMRIINEDENLFLYSVEVGKGKLENIVEDIQKNGELTDDLSLLRIGFKEGHTEIKKDIPKDFYEYKSKGVSAYQKRKYKEAIHFFEKAVKLYDDNECYNKLIYSCIKIDLYLKALTITEKAVKLYPGDLEIMFSASYLYKKDDQYDRAIYYGKRYQIHKDSMKNLINLADSYRLLGDYKNAKKIVKEADKLEPNNVNIKKLKKVLDKIET